MSKFESLWYWQKQRLTNEWFEVYAFNSDDRPKTTTIIGGENPSPYSHTAHTTVDENGNLRLFLHKEQFPEAPDFWYVLIPERNGITKTQSLAAFANSRFEDGVVIDLDYAQKINIDISERAAAIRWGFGDPKVEQIYVAEEFRRMRSSIKLIAAADMTNMAGNWGGYLYGGDQLTSMGESLASSWLGSARLIKQNVSVKND